jgi:hypothetical protein
MESRERPLPTITRPLISKATILLLLWLWTHINTLIVKKYFYLALRFKNTECPSRTGNRILKWSRYGFCFIQGRCRVRISARIQADLSLILIFSFTTESCRFSTAGYSSTTAFHILYNPLLTNHSIIAYADWDIMWFYLVFASLCRVSIFI